MTDRFMDCWTPHPRVPRREINRHTPIQGEIAREWEIDKYRFMRLTDGRVFCQHVNYWVKSPHGWEYCYTVQTDPNAPVIQDEADALKYA